MWANSINYWSISSIILTEEAKKLWLDVEIISRNKNLFRITGNWKKILCKSTDFWVNSSLGSKISDDKELTYNILEQHNLPTAKSYYINASEISSIKNLEIIFPVIIKPLQEWHWNGVLMNILTVEELIEKLEKSFQIYKRMIIQRQIEGEEYRILVMDWEVIIALNRIPAQIIWNWKNTINECIDSENETNPLRWVWYDRGLSKIQIDDELISYINKQDLKLDSIVPNWKTIRLRWNSNIWTWWTPVDVTSIIHPSILDVAYSATKALWLQFAWVDIITNDLLQPLNKTSWVILEVWSTPWLWWDHECTWVNTWKIILEKLFFWEHIIKSLN